MSALALILIIAAIINNPFINTIYNLGGELFVGGQRTPCSRVVLFPKLDIFFTLITDRTLVARYKKLFASKKETNGFLKEIHFASDFMKITDRNINRFHVRHETALSLSVFKNV